MALSNSSASCGTCPREHLGVGVDSRARALLCETLEPMLRDERMEGVHGEQKRLEYAIRAFGETKITQLQKSTTTDDTPGGDESESGDQNDSELSSSSSGGETSSHSIGESKASIMDIKSQKVFRELCSLMDSETNPSQVIDDRMDRTKDEMEGPDQVDELDIEFGHYHHPSFRCSSKGAPRSRRSTWVRITTGLRDNCEHR